MTTAADRPALSLVKDSAAADTTEPTIIEGTVIKHPTATTQRPDLINTSKTFAHQTANAAHRLHLPQAARGYGKLARAWIDAYRRDYPQLINSARAALKAAQGDVKEENRLHGLVELRREEYKRHRLTHVAKTSIGAAFVAGTAAAGDLTGGLLADLLMGAVVIAVGAWHGRQDRAVMQTVTAGGELSFDAPPPPAIDEATLQKAVNDAGFPGQIKILKSVRGADGTTTTVFDLPSGATVAALQKKLEALAAALGRDVSMVDVTKAGAAGRPSLWMTDTDPFETPRPSPLLGMHGGIDAYRDGVPVAWNKRGATVRLPINNSSFVIGGMTRSGKGVGAANLVAGAAMDVRVNLRLVAGKTNGEWDAYARSGVAATYFKPNPHRLLALIQGLRADMNRRNTILGELGKSKLTPQTIERLGGIELLVIDELATYTRSGSPLREEILKESIELSAVAAGAGILLMLITQYPEVDVLPQALAMNCGTRWAMRVDNATQSNAILGGGASGSGRDASKFDPPRPGLGWLVNPFAGVTDLARSFDLDEDERGEITGLMQRAAELRQAAGRLVGQWKDPIEQQLLNATGLSSAAGGPQRNGEPGREVAFLTDEQRRQLEAVRGALAAMDELDRDAAQLDEMAELIGPSMTAERLGELLRAAGAGGTVKITVPHKPGRVNGYRREDVADALKFLHGA